MTIAIGEAIPSVTLRTLTADGPADIDTATVFGSGTVVLFAVPGAFTPTCSAKHLPGFLDYADRLKEKGVDRIVCTAVNDPFVMRAWAEKAGVGERILMLPDGNGTFAAALGLTVDLSANGMGVRSRRYALIARDGKVVHLAIEEAGQFGASSAPEVFAALG